MNGPNRWGWDLKAVPAPRRGSGNSARVEALYGDIPRLTEEFNDLVLRHANGNGELPDDKAVEAAEIAHKLFLLHDQEADHYWRLSLEHRSGTS